MSTLNECLATLEPVLHGDSVGRDVVTRALGASRGVLEKRMRGDTDDDPFATAESVEGPLVWILVLNLIWDATLSDKTDPSLRSIFHGETKALESQIVPTTLKLLKETDLGLSSTSISNVGSRLGTSSSVLKESDTVRGKRILAGELLLKFVLNNQMDGSRLCELISWLQRVEYPEKSVSSVYVLCACLAALDSTPETVELTAHNILSLASDKIHALINGKWHGSGIELWTVSRSSVSEISNPHDMIHGLAPSGQYNNFGSSFPLSNLSAFTGINSYGYGSGVSAQGLGSASSASAPNNGSQMTGSNLTSNATYEKFSVDKKSPLSEQPGIQTILQLAWGNYMAVASIAGINIVPAGGGKPQLVSGTTAEDQVLAAFDNHVWSHIGRGGLLSWGRGVERDSPFVEMSEYVSKRRMEPKDNNILKLSQDWLDMRYADASVARSRDPWNDIIMSREDEGRQNSYDDAQAHLEKLTASLQDSMKSTLSQNRLTFLPESNLNSGSVLAQTSSNSNASNNQLYNDSHNSNSNIGNRNIYPSSGAAASTASAAATTSQELAYGVPIMAHKPESTFIQKAILTQIETLLKTCIQHMAVALRRLRTQQDDVNIALTRGVADARPMYELEALFLVVAKLGSQSAELAFSFWDVSQPKSAFVPWALDANTSPRTRLASINMCAALAYGYDAATACFEFFTDFQRPTSWEALLQALAFYAQNVSMDSTTAFQSMKPTPGLTGSQMAYSTNTGGLGLNAATTGTSNYHNPNASFHGPSAHSTYMGNVNNVPVMLPPQSTPFHSTPGPSTMMSSSSTGIPQQGSTASSNFNVSAPSPGPGGFRLNDHNSVNNLQYQQAATSLSVAQGNIASSAGTASSSATVSQPAEIPAQEVIHLIAYLRLMTAVVDASDVAGSSLANSFSPKPLTSIFTLLRRNIPDSLRAALLDTVSAFARPSMILRDSVTFRTWSFLQTSGWIPQQVNSSASEQQNYIA